LHRDPGSEEDIAILFNDTALSGAPLDEGKQARAALLCSLLGRAWMRAAKSSSMRDIKKGHGVIHSSAP